MVLRAEPRCKVPGMGSELSELLVRREWLQTSPYGIADEVLGADECLGLFKHHVDQIARDYRYTVGVTDHVVAGRRW